MPGYWMNEGGQSATGQVIRTDIEHLLLPLYTYHPAQLLHFITTTHPAYGRLLKVAEEENLNPYEGLCFRLVEGPRLTSSIQS